MNPTLHAWLNLILILAALLGVSAFLPWIERRLLAVWQDRYGPNRVGPFGILQTLADAIKMLTKEDWVPPFSDKPVFVIAPVVIAASTLLAFAVVPVAPGIGIVDLNIGLLFFLAVSSLAVYSIVLGGWASNNKYALLGGFRAAAQMLSYEVFMGLSVMGVVMLAGSFNLREIVEAQRGLWFFIPQILGLITFAVAAIAETRRHEIRLVFHWRIYRHHRHVGDDRHAVFRRLAGTSVAAVVVVCAQDGGRDCDVHPDARIAAAAALRPVDRIWMDADVAAEPGQSCRDRCVGVAARLKPGRMPQDGEAKWMQSGIR